MSRDPRESEPPRRSGPNPRRPRDPEPTDEESAESSTFQPRKKAPKPRSGLPGEREPMPPGPTLWERILFGRVGTAQLARFCRQFAAYLDAGVDIFKALTNLELQFGRTALGPVIGRLRVGVQRGDTLTELVEREPQAFDSLFVSLMRVAEARGGVPETLYRLSTHYEARLSLIRQARSAMIYPITVLVFAGGTIALITIWILPQFIAMLKDIAGKAPLPLPSRMLMAFSEFVRQAGWWIIPLVVIGTPIAIWQFYRTAKGKLIMDEVAMRMPVLGSLLRKIDTTRFARTLSVLLAAGVDMGTSLDLTAGVMQLEPFRRSLRNARRGVIEGDGLSEALDLTARFGPDVIAIVESGEETGRLPESLTRLADDYEEQVAYMVKNMGQLVQPILLVFMAGIVLFIILAVILPYISILTNLAGGAAG